MEATSPLVALSRLTMAEAGHADQVDAKVGESIAYQCVKLISASSGPLRCILLDDKVISRTTMEREWSDGHDGILSILPATEMQVERGGGEQVCVWRGESLLGDVSRAIFVQLLRAGRIALLASYASVLLFDRVVKGGNAQKSPYCFSKKEKKSMFLAIVDREEGKRLPHTLCLPMALLPSNVTGLHRSTSLPSLPDWNVTYVLSYLPPAFRCCPLGTHTNFIYCVDFFNQKMKVKGWRGKENAR